MKRYYLSEMAIADKGGGGLTLQRVLQDDLQAFDQFIHVDDYATRVSPIAVRFADRQLNLHEACPGGNVGFGRARFHVDRMLSKLGLKTTRQRSIIRWCRRAADHILKHIDLDDSSWLVVPQNIKSVLVMNEVQRSRPVRYVTWVMDDHVVRWNNGLRYPVWFEAEFRYHLQNADKVLVISPAMQQFYRQRFGVESEVVFGPAEPVGEPVYRSASPLGPVRLAYFGSIWPWQRDALERLIANLTRLNASLDVFGFHDLPEDLRSPMVHVRAAVPAGEVIAQMRQYDGIVIPAGFGEEVRHLSELNISTKLSECLACGTIPVLVAPEWAAMVRFAREHGGAVIVIDFDNADQVRDLKDLKSGDLRRRVLDEAQRVVSSQCSTDIMRRRWLNAWQEFSNMASPALQAVGS